MELLLGCCQYMRLLWLLLRFGLPLLNLSEQGQKLVCDVLVAALLHVVALLLQDLGEHVQLGVAEGLLLRFRLLLFALFLFDFFD